MPIDDYDREKTLQATSFNDSGATVDKAQPVILRGNDFTGIDGFESGSSQLNFESNANVTVDSNGEIYGDDSLKFSSSNSDVVEFADFTSKINSDGKRLSGSVKIDNQTGNSSDKVAVGFSDGIDVNIRLTFEGNGDITNFAGTVVDSWSAGTIIDFEIVVDFTNDQYDVIINDSTVASNLSFNSSTNEITGYKIFNDTTGSGSTVNAFFDRLTYSPAPEDSVNAGGFIGYDSSTVTDAQDVGFYDQNDNLLDYEIENGGDLGSSSAEVVAWVYRDYTRDDSDQVKFAFGNNSANTDRQNVTGTWNHTGQNTFAAYHFDETSGDYLDSTSNSRDIDQVTITSRTADGQFAKSPEFDGTDDKLKVSSPNFPYDTKGTVTAWFRLQQLSSTVGNIQYIFNNRPGTGSEEIILRVATNDKLNACVNDGSFKNVESNSTLTTDTWFRATIVIDEGNNMELFLDGASQGTSSIGTVGDPDNLGIGYKSSPANTDFLDGFVDEVKYFTDVKDSAWVQADFDASPKGNQVFFTQDAAQDTAGALTATVTDSFDLTEETSFLLKFTASDNLTVQENEEGTLSDLLDDNVAFNENIRSTIITSLTDQLGFAEEASRKIFQDVSDQLGFSEDINATLALTVLVSDSLQFAENVDSELRDALRDDLQLNENVESRLIDSLADQIGFTEFV